MIIVKAINTNFCLIRLCSVWYKYPQYNHCKQQLKVRVLVDQPIHASQVYSPFLELIKLT